MSDQAVPVPAASAPAAQPAPFDLSGYLRPGIRGVDVLLACGMTITIAPALSTASQVLGRVIADDHGYARAAARCRDQMIAFTRTKKPEVMIDTDWDALVVLAIQSAYDLTTAEILGAPWLDDRADTMAIVRAAWGDNYTTKERKRAIALACAGLADVPLSAIESAALADWAWNSKRAPPFLEG